MSLSRKQKRDISSYVESHFLYSGWSSPQIAAQYCHDKHNSEYLLVLNYVYDVIRKFKAKGYDATF